MGISSWTNCGHRPVRRIPGAVLAALALLAPVLCVAQVPPAPALQMSLLYAAPAGSPTAGDPQPSVGIFSASSRSRVEKAAECFRKVNPGVATMLGDDGTPAAWRLLAATHVTSGEAANARQALLNGLDYPRAMACLGSAAPANVAALKAQTEVLSQTPRLQPRAAPAVFDGVGALRRRSDNAARYAIVEGRYYAESVQVAAAIASFQGRFPDVHFVAIRHDGFYFAAVTGFVDATGQAAARHAMRQRGAMELTALATFKPVKTELRTPASTDLVSLQGALLPKPSPSTSTAEPVATEVLEYEDLFEALQPRVVRCYQGYDGQLNTGDGMLVNAKINWVSADRLTQCAGVVLHDATLTRCLLESDCLGLRLPLGFRFTAQDLVQRCLLGFGGDAAALPRDIACAATRLDPVYRAVMERNGLLSCAGTNAGSSAACKEFRDLLTTLCASPESKELCANAPATTQELQQRTALVIDCLWQDSRRCVSLVPRPLDAARRFSEEVDRLNRTGAKLNPAASLKVQKTDLGALGAATATMVDKFKACNDKRGKDEAGAVACFRDLALKPAETAALECVTKAGADAAQRTRCFVAAGSKEAEMLDRAHCAAQADGQPARLVQCAGGDAAAVDRAVKDYQCVTGSASALEAARKCVTGLSPQATQALNCAAQPGLDAAGYSKCMAGIDQNYAAAQCMWEASTDQARLACVANKLPLPQLPPAAQQALACAAAGGDVAEIGGCVAAANLPPEVGKAVQCAAGSTGAVDFALCAVDVGLNPELRIAAECASTTGGEPISFTACAGGRLTLRELQKCLSGEIGKEGGCFGPNNTLVKALNDMGRDLQQGLGPTNDLVVAMRDIEQGINKLGEEVSKGLQRVGDDAKRGDIGKAISRVFGW